MRARPLSRQPAGRGASQPCPAGPGRAEPWGVFGRLSRSHSFLPGHKAPQRCPACLPFSCLPFSLSPPSSLPPRTPAPVPAHPPRLHVNTVAQTRSCQPAVVGGGPRRMPSLPGRRRSNWHLSEAAAHFRKSAGPCRPAAGRLGLRASLCPALPQGCPQLRPSHPAAGGAPQMAPGPSLLPEELHAGWAGPGGGRRASPGVQEARPRAETCSLAPHWLLGPPPVLGIWWVVFRAVEKGPFGFGLGIWGRYGWGEQGR